MLPDIFTSVDPEEAAELAVMARDCDVLEIGSWEGFSTIVMAREARRVHAVDWHQGDAHAGSVDTLPRLWKNLERFEVRDRVVIHVGRSENVLPTFRPESFDLAFIDAFHETEAVFADALLTLPLMRPGGLIAFHDYGLFGVAPAVDMLVKAEQLQWIGLTKSLAVTRVP